jgi:hypothetical protein
MAALFLCASSERGCICTLMAGPPHPAFARFPKPFGCPTLGFFEAGFYRDSLRHHFCTFSVSALSIQTRPRFVSPTFRSKRRIEDRAPERWLGGRS